MDRIEIRELHVRCVLGADDEERRELQDVLVGAVLHAHLGAAGRRDRLDDAIEYRGMKKRILAAAEGSRHRLAEALAERVAAICLEDARVRPVDVTVEKPASLRFARSAAVVITRASGTASVGMTAYRRTLRAGSPFRVRLKICSILVRP